MPTQLALAYAQEQRLQQLAGTMPPGVDPPFLAPMSTGLGEVFQYVVQFITNKYQNSEIMGMDAVFVHMALNYYCPGPNKPSRAYWMSDENLEKLCERARKMAPLVIGSKAPNIILTDSTEQNWIGFHGLPQEYVVLIFWDPHCGHCKKEMPGWYEVYKNEMKDLGIEVFAVAKAVDESLMRDWKKFLRENDLNWINVGLTKTVFEEAIDSGHQ